MNQSKPRYIGINQRIPFAVLDDGLAAVIEKGSIERAELRQHMLQFTKGVNRADKAAGYARTVLTRPEELITAIKTSFTAESYRKLPVQERKLLILSLVAVSYPIFYDLLVGMAKAFKVQANISTSAIHQLLGKLYGSNRTLAVAIDAILPMLIELDVLKRSKISIYELMPPRVALTPIVNEAWIYAGLKASGEKTVQQADLTSRSWYHFVAVTVPTHAKLLDLNSVLSRDGHIAAKRTRAVEKSL